jgi:hypothetical protein
MESKEKKKERKNRRHSRMVILYEYCMRSGISSHWPKVHYGMPTEKRKSFDLMMVIHMYICLGEKRKRFSCSYRFEDRKRKGR